MKDKDSQKLKELEQLRKQLVHLQTTVNKKVQEVDAAIGAVLVKAAPGSSMRKKMTIEQRMQTYM